MDFDALIAIARSHHQQPGMLISIPKEWSQGRTVFGGPVGSNALLRCEGIY